jgi:hypothetical protein
MFSLTHACRMVRQHRSGLSERTGGGCTPVVCGKAPGTSPQKRNFTGEVLLQPGIHYSFYRPIIAAILCAVDPLSLTVKGVLALYRESATYPPSPVSTYRPQSMRHINSKSLCSKQAIAGTVIDRVLRRPWQMAGWRAGSESRSQMHHLRECVGAIELEQGGKPSLYPLLGSRRKEEACHEQRTAGVDTAGDRRSAARSF